MNERELPDGWRWELLPNLGKLGRGKSKHRPRYDPILYGGEYPFFQTGDVKAANKILLDYQQTYSERGLAQSKLWPTGTLCITIAANIAETAILGIDACFPDSVVGLIADKEKCDIDYLYYYFQYAKRNIQQFAYGSVQENINLSVLNSVYIALPFLPIQRRIADILAALDDKIGLNRRMNHTLEAMAQALYKHWFVNFGPFQDSGFVDSELGPIPKGWCREPLKSHVEVVKGLSYKGSGLAEKGEGLPLHNLNSILEGGGYKYKGMKYYTGEYKARHTIKTGDLIVANTEQGFEYLLIGSPAIVPRFFGSEGLFSHHLFRVRPRPDSPLTVNFMYLQLRYPSYRRWITRFTNGTTVNMLFPEALKDPTTIVPPQEIVERFEKIVAPLLSMVETNHEEVFSLSDTRDYLLPKLLSGEIEVEAAEEIVEDVL